MIELRGKVRTVLSDMGFRNPVSMELAGKTAFITIHGWKPCREALELKKGIERAVDTRVEISFAGPAMNC